MTYSLTFAVIASFGYFSSSKTLPHLIVYVIVLLWALRLGSFLMKRVHKLGRDDRFDNIRPYPLKFLGFWIMQALTCVIVSLSVLILFSEIAPEMSLWFLCGIGIATFGLLLETIADHQKYTFKNNHPDSFMNSGVWKKIRHPNYTGEMLFWLGLSITALNISNGYVALVSPFWISFILLRFSGIPILRRNAEKKYGADTAYQKYVSDSWYLFPYLY